MQGKKISRYEVQLTEEEMSTILAALAAWEGIHATIYQEFRDLLEEPGSLT